MCLAQGPQHSDADKGVESCGFRQEDFFMFSVKKNYIKTCDLWGRTFLTKGHLNRHGKVALGDATN